MSETTGIDWNDLIWHDKIPIARGFMAQQDFPAICEAAAQIALSRANTLTPELLDVLFQEWQSIPIKHGQSNGNAVWSFKQLIKQELEGKN